MHRATIRPIAITLVALSVLAGAPAASSQTDPLAPLEPAAGSLFGAYVQSSGGSTRTAVETSIRAVETQLGRKLGLDHHFFPWGKTIPGWQAGWDHANGRAPMVTWGDVDVAAINAGTHDAYIQGRADAFKAVGQPVFLRWFAEMDADAKSAMARSPAEYISAWRRIHNTFTQRGATNVAWVWCPTAYGFKTGRAQTFYPGDAYVDWLCADGYNWAPERNGAPWNAFETIFDPFYDWGLTTGKPMMAGETGVMERNTGEKAQWIRDAYDTARVRYPEMKAIVYFDAVRYEHGGTYDWRIDTSPGALQALAQAAAAPHFSPGALSSLTVQTSGAGQGAVTSQPGGIDCGSLCTGTFTTGSSVTLTAAPSSTSTFTGWSGGCSGTAKTCTVTLDSVAAVTASFAIKRHGLTVKRAGTGGGTVTSGAGVTCGADCSETYVAGTTVQLSAQPAADSAFAGWSGPCAGSGLECVLTMNADQTVTAIFDAVPEGSNSLTVIREGAGTGVVTVSPGGTPCAMTCLFQFPSGSSVTVRATPEGTATFTGWGDDCQGTAPDCTVVLDANRVVRAGFGTEELVHKPEAELAPVATTKRKQEFTLEIANAGNVADSYVLDATEGSRTLRVRYLSSGVDITGAAVAGTYVLHEIAPGAVEEVTMVVRPSRRAPARTKKALPLVITSTTQPGAVSVLTPTVRFKRRR
jgi:hypothetical protein